MAFYYSSFRKHFLLSLILFTFFSFPTYPQSDSVRTYSLTDVVVTATRTETSTLEIASSISVIDSADIANTNGIDLTGLLKGQYGLTMSQSGGPGQLSQVLVRGANPEHILVEIDGVKINQPDDVNNSTDFSYISLDDVQRIEILRGPQSTLYGSDAMSGVINIITKKGRGKPSYFLDLEGGSFGTYKALLGTNGNHNNINYSFTTI